MNTALISVCSEFTEFDIVDDDTAAIVSNMVVLAGMDAVVATHRDSSDPAAETGRPETSKEFAQRMRGKFVLRGPRERTEGENGSKLPITPVTEPVARQRTDDHVNTDVDRDVTQSAMEADLPSEPDSDTGTSLINVLNQDAEIDLLKELQGHYQDDPIFKPVLERPKDFRNFEVKDNLIYLKLDGKSLLGIPKIMINGRNLHEIIISEAHSVLAHLGANKTVNYLRDHVWWKEMVSDVKSYCETCVTCKRSKPNNQKLYGLLNPLAVLTEPWESIGVDFVGPLPLSRNLDGEYDSITVVICLLTTMVEVIHQKKLTLSWVALGSLELL